MTVGLRLLFPCIFLHGWIAPFSAEAARVRHTRDPQELAHTLFGCAAKATTMNGSVSGPERAIGIFSRSDNDPAATSKSGIVLSTGDAKSPSASSSIRPAASSASNGDEQLSQITSANTRDAAAISFDFQTAPDVKNIRINVAFVSQESSTRMGQGFDDVFAVFIDGELVEFVRGSETREPEPNQNSSSTANNVRVITQSKLIDLTGRKMHSLKLAVADVGDNNGDSLAFVSIDGNDEHPPFVASTGFGIPPRETPKTREWPALQRFEPPNTTHPVIPSFPLPPFLENRSPVSVPERGSSLLLSSMALLSLLFANFLRRQIAENA
jgi:hypothetical protein